MTHSSSLISFFLLVLLFLCVVSSSRGSERETGSLLEFKKGISNDPLGKIQSTWNLSSLPDPKACPVSWTGVTCDPASDSVISIDLSQMGLYGDLKFSTLLNLKELQNLSLAGNNFSGRLVPALGSMSSLKYLDLSGNSFIGPIPGRIMDLWGLNYLNLSGNKFEGGLQVSFRNLQQLRVLDLHSNQLKGDIGQVLSGLRNVEIVDLSLNQFYGGLGGVSVDNVSGIVNTMKAMNLSQNGLNGRFFPGDVMGLFKSLEVLDLSGNAISGELPVGSFGNLMNLKVLRLGNNQLFGMVPEDLLQSVVPIQELDLSGNGFTGSIPGINSPSLNVLNLSSNSLSGSLLSSLKSCKTMDLSRNMISGDISVMKNWETSLEFLDLSSNKLSGSLPNLTSQFYRLNTLNLRNNSLVGNLPSLMETTPRLVAVDLSSNGFSGSIPGSFFTSNNLVSLNLSSNKFVGPIPFQGSRASELLVLPTYPLMESLDLSDNSLEGVLPSDIGNLGRLKLLNLANNGLSGQLPTALGKLSDLEYLDLSGNKFNDGMASTNDAEGKVPAEVKHHSSKNSIRVAIIVASVGAALMIVFVLLAYHRAQLKEFHGHYLGRQNLPTEITEQTEGVAAGSASMNPNLMDIHPATSGRKSSPGSPLSSSPRFVEAYEQPVKLDVYSPDRLAGELFFLDASLAFTAEELSRAPAEVLGRSSHGTLYKATLDSGHMLTVKWLRVGLVKHKKEFAKEVKKIGSMRHPNIVPLRAYYWGPREQERLLLADYIQGDSLSLHLYESTPRRYSPLSFIQRLKVAVDVARCLLYLHDRGLPHGNLKPTNILLTGQDYNVRLTDYGLHRLMTAAGIAEQILNLGALGYRAPELANASRPAPSFKADVYAFGVILMELLTRRSAGDIISGQSGAVDLTDWVRLCDQEGRGMDCIDRDIAGGEEPTKAMDDLLAISLRCILPVNERPNIRQVFDDLYSISS
ncbi:hypothetical protein Pint_26791 [Pistacia integerrima]|uniref:Uncharacterized protein n=1 Tax=Pistacia integerrima TaxID=434235 RepID=A0ACC0YPV4_9ROSI|nr:hypothetical protein Pint_26791 [Pistacia integerrima]